MKSNELRRLFIEFFQKKQHEVVSSAPIIPDNDPSLLFINAGMNQFKDVFLGSGKRDYTRAVNSQICVRVSGKHNDLEDVGKDSTHLTSFEMLGNWSFGDYYKKEAISWAWEFFTEVLQIPKYRLVATVFEEDDDSLSLWKTQTDINPAQIVKCDAVDNFWEMGAVGPCGPCSEIHVFLEDKPIDFELNQTVLNSGQFIELWNLVFIQFNRLEDKSLVPLPQKHVDTGAGLERIAAFLQQTSSNYETDLFAPIINKIVELSGIAYSEGSQGMPHRVIADHCRTLCFGIADTVMPSNEGRGYVLRRLLRRASRYAKQLDMNKPMIYQLVPIVIDTLGGHFTHLKEQESYIARLIKSEEESFLNTLSSGLVLLDTLVQKLKKNHQTMIPGIDAFKLYDTYGFPVDLTVLLAQEQRMSVDLKAFQRCLADQKQRSRKGSKFQDQVEEVPKRNVTEAMFKGLELHLAENLNIAKGGEARIVSDRKEKVQMAQHHSATHLLQSVLRDCLGTHVHQSGSLVDSSRLRFDFTHFESINKETLKDIEVQINKQVMKHHPVSVSHATLEQAKAKGVMALFGEKYDADCVRIVDIGGYSVELCAGTHVKNTSQIEYVKIIAESAISAGNRRIEAIAGDENVRSYLIQIREKKLSELTNQLIQVKENLSDDSKTVVSSLNKLIENITPKKELTIMDIEDELSALNTFEVALKQLLKTAQKKNQQQDLKEKQQIAKTLVAQDHSSIVCYQSNDMSIKELKQLADEITVLAPNRCALLYSVYNETGQLVIKLGPKYSNTDSDAGVVIKEVTARLGGGGGGRKQMAQAGGIPQDQLDNAVAMAKEKLT